MINNIKSVATSNLTFDDLETFIDSIYGNCYSLTIENKNYKVTSSLTVIWK